MMSSLMWRMAWFQRRCIVSHISVVIVFNCLQAKLDDALEEIVLKLSDKYHPGLCPLHPDLPYFHHHASDLHFKLDRPQLLVWALAIRSDTTTYEKVPILSPMFNASSALKHVSKNTTNSNAAAAPMMTMPPTMCNWPGELDAPVSMGTSPNNFCSFVLPLSVPCTLSI